MDREGRGGRAAVGPPQPPLAPREAYAPDVEARVVEARRARLLAHYSQR